MNQPDIGIFGEVLFDHFPDGKRVLGGAPFNVAWHLQAFGQNPHFISRVGRDAQGDQVRQTMTDWGMDTAALQADPTRPTGKVNIQFIDGEPEYDIQQDCAYDAIESVELSGGFDFLYHGSLALRDKTSAAALAKLKANHPRTLFIDVNLRSPWWNIDHLVALLGDADWVKLNQHELSLLNEHAKPDDDLARGFIKRFGLHGLILTQGSAGASIYTDVGDHFSIAPEPDSDVIDTVGAGDAFASIMILGLVNSWALDTTMQRAQSFASETLRHRGALLADISIYQRFVQAWNLSV